MRANVLSGLFKGRNIETTIEYDGAEGIVTTFIKGSIDEGYCHAQVGEVDLLTRWLDENDYHELGEYIRRRECAGESVAYLSGMEVRPSGKGYGGALLTAMMEALISLRVVNIYLHAAPDAGRVQDLARFYRRHGFKLVRCCTDDPWRVWRKLL